MKLRHFSTPSSVVVNFSSTVVLLLFCAPGFAGTLVVDDDFADCRHADFSSIQLAINAAQPGDKILVCPGVYSEAVVVSTPDLRIEARGAPGEVVLQGTPTQQYGFHLLNTTGVRLQGFTVKGFRQANIIIEGGGGNTLHKNIATEAAIDGIEVIDSDANVVEQNISFANSGPRSDGIFVTGPLNDAGARLNGSNDNVIRHNETFSNGNLGINLNLSGTGNVVTGNRSHHNGVRGIQSSQGSNMNVIEHNHVFENGLVPVPGVAGVGIGIFVFMSTGVTVRNNLSEKNGTNGIGLTQAIKNVVSHNRSESNNLAGMQLNNSANENLIELNQITGNVQDGIRLMGNSDGNTIQQNHIRRNGRDGIRVVDAASGDNRIERNVIAESGEHDAHDDSAGAGTGGTANFWIDNHCETENRFGLCSVPK